MRCSADRDGTESTQDVDISVLNREMSWAEIAPTAKEDLEFPHVVVETGVVDGYNPIEPGTRLEGRRRLLCFFLHRHLSFRLPEFQGVAELTYGRTTWDDGLPVTVWERALDDMARGPFWYVHLPDDGDGLALKNGKIIAENCFLLKALIDPWADAHSLPELKERLAAFDPVEKAKFGAASWKAQPETWGMSLTQDQKVAMLMELAPSLPEFHGPISLKNPEQIYWIVASWPFEFPVAYLRSWIFFGRQVGIGTNRGTILNKYDLSRRRYLGPTTMDTELAFLMCSLAGVRRSSLVFDPFVGTGGLLVPAAHHGARTMGMDIDIRVIKWGKKDSKGRHVNIWTNFEDYGLEPPVALLRADLDRNPFKDGMREVFDVILADPPYGVRAGGRKSRYGPDKLVRNRETHIPATEPYPLGDCLADMLDFGARVLVPGGRLAYWAPALPVDGQGVAVAATSDEAVSTSSSSDEIPKHPNLIMKFNCEQILGGRYNRRLIVMEKIKGKRYDPNEVRQYFEANPPVTMSIDTLWDIVYAPVDKNTDRRTRGGDNPERTRTFRSKLV